MKDLSTINIPKSIHKQLKVLAAHEQTTIMQLILEAIKETYEIEFED